MSHPTLPATVNVLLLSTYDLGRQPFGLASPAAWLRGAGAEVLCQDLAIEPLDEQAVRSADLVAFYLPMHTATRIASQIAPRVLLLNPGAHLCFYGLYAPLNEPFLRALGAGTVLGGEFETGLVSLAHRLSTQKTLTATGAVLQPAGVHGSLEPSVQRGKETRPSRVPSGGEREFLREDDAASREHRTVSAREYGRTRVRQETPQLGVPVALQPEPLISVARQVFLRPDRTGLPPLSKYARLALGHQDGKGEGETRTVGYTEASRGCRHRCRHCPIVPVYDGKFRIVQQDIVLADIRQQVAAGAEHVTFGDPDFFNGVGHALALARAIHDEHPDLTYDVTIKIEHLLRYAKHLPALRETGCLFVTSAVESIDDRVLALLDKGHTRDDFGRVVGLFREVGLVLNPTFVPFTPWTTVEGYRDLLALLDELDLLENVAPIQLAIRLLIPAGSRLLELSQVRDLVGPFDARALVHPWRHKDSRVDDLQREVQKAVEEASQRNEARHEIFALVANLAERAAGHAPERSSHTWEKSATAAPGAGPVNARSLAGVLRNTLVPGVPRTSRAAVPYLTEPWYC